MGKRDILLHKRTRVDNSMPTADMLQYGEIAMNYANGHETLFVRSSDDSIAEFKADEFNSKRYLQNVNNVFTTFETEEAYNTAVETGAIVAPNTSYIVETGKIKTLDIDELPAMTEYNMKAVITPEWLKYWDDNITSQGCEYIYLCEFWNSELISQNEQWKNFKGLASENITSFIVNGVECRDKFITIPAIANLQEGLSTDNENRVGYGISRWDVCAGDVFDIKMVINCEPFHVADSAYGALARFDIFNITPIYYIDYTEQLQKLVRDEANDNCGLMIETKALQEIKYSGDFSLSLKCFTTDTSAFSYLPKVYDHWNGFEYVTSSIGIYNSILDAQSKMGYNKPSLTVYLPLNNPTYGDPNDVWDGSTDSGKTMWGVHNYYLNNKWNQSDFQYGVVDGPNLVAWKSNYNFKVVGYNEETI